MKLHSPHFERALRRAVNRTIRASPALRKERKQQKRSRHFSASPIIRALVTLVPALLGWAAYSSTGHLATAIVILNLWLLHTLCFRAGYLINILSTSKDSDVLLHLPIGDEDVFRWHWQKYVRSYGFTLLDVILAYAVIAIIAQLSWQAWLAVVPLALLATVAHLALATWLAAFLPRVALLGQAFAFFSLVAYFVIGRLTESAAGKSHLPQWLDHNAGWINAIVPTGWGASLLQIVAQGLNWSTCLNLLLVIVLLGSLRYSVHKLKSGFGFTEVVAPEPSDITGELDLENIHTDHPTRVGVTTIEEAVETGRMFDIPAARSGGALERWLWQWLSPREQTLMDFAFVNGISLSASWKKIFRNLLIGLLLTWTMGRLNPGWAVWIFGGTLLITGLHALGLIYATGTCFQPCESGGMTIPFCAGFPVGLKELARALGKLTLIQLPLITCLATAATAVAQCLIPGPSLQLLSALEFGGKAAALIVIARFPLLALKLSSSTNDTSRVTLKSLTLALLFVLAALTFAGLAAAGFLAPARAVQYGCIFLALLMAWLMFCTYNWFYNRNKFDLMSPPKPS